MLLKFGDNLIKLVKLKMWTKMKNFVSINKAYDDLMLHAAAQMKRKKCFF